MISLAGQTNNAPEPVEVPGTEQSASSEERPIGPFFPGDDERPVVPKTFKPLIAGGMLILVFIFVIFVVLNSVLGTYETMNSDDDVTLDGVVKDSNSDPIAGVEVTIEGTDIIVYTNETGVYEIPNAPVGEQVIRFYKEGYRVVSVREIFYNKETLKRNNWDSNSVSLPGWITGGVYVGPLKGPYVDRTLNHLENITVRGKINSAEGAPLSNVNVSITGTLLWTTTDENGNYTIENAPVGRYEVRAVNDTLRSNEYISYITLLKPAVISELDFRFDSFTTNNTFDLTAEKFGEISGKVVDADDKPLASAELHLYGRVENNEVFNITYTDQDGNFKFPAVPVGLYNLTASWENHYINRSCNITIEENSVVTENFSLKTIGTTREVLSDFNVIYYCLIILVTIALIALLGGINAYRRKRYSLAFTSAIIGIIPALVMTTDECICGSAVLAVIALLLIVFSRNEFE